MDDTTIQANRGTPQEEGILIYNTWWQEIEDFMNDGEPQLALEMLLAIGRYCFYGEEYTGTIGEIRRNMKTKMYQIDKQRGKYQSAHKGGRNSCAITDEELLTAVNSGEFTSRAEIGRQYGITGAAVGQRMKKLGLEFGRLNTLPSKEKASAFESKTNANESKVNNENAIEIERNPTYNNVSFTSFNLNSGESSLSKAKSQETKTQHKYTGFGSEPNLERTKNLLDDDD